MAYTVSLLANVQLDNYFRRAALSKMNVSLEAMLTKSPKSLLPLLYLTPN